MAGVKTLRQRITSVGNIKKITRAMEMVATTKFRPFQDLAISSRPYTEEITGLMERVSIGWRRGHHCWYGGHWSAGWFAAGRSGLACC